MPTIGEIEWVDGPTYGAAANWNENNTVGPTPWQLAEGYSVIQYQDERGSDFGRTSLNVALIQAGGTFAGMAQVQGMFDDAINLAVQYGDTSLAASLESKRTSYESLVTSYSANHTTISVTVTAEGGNNFFDQTGASIQGKLRLLQIFLGTPTSVQQESLAALQQVSASRPVHPSLTQHHLIFFNSTSATVVFHVSPPEGQPNIQLLPGTRASVTVTSHAGGPIQARVAQPAGGVLDFPVADGSYSFVKSGDEITVTQSH